MFIALLFIVGTVVTVQGGTFCPPREDIYPCSCVSVPLTKKTFHTVVSCHRLPNTDALGAIFPTLRQMQIDQFYLYDSFWEAQNLGAEHSQKLPSDWMSLVRIKEFEIVDTPLAAGFACDSKINCRNSVTTRFTARNCSVSEKVFSMCDTPRGDKYSWVGCMEKMKHFHMSNANLGVIKREFFPVPMRELITLNLTNNMIRKIDGIFGNLSKVKSVDLSHNSLEILTNVFKGAEKLEFLDLSWNILVSISPDFFQSVPSLKSLAASNNHIQMLKESEWKTAPGSLRNIDLRENPLHCDCDIIWINGTFHINVILQGVCATPEEYENSLLRRASRFLGERCDDEGNIGTRKKTKTTPSL